MLVRPRFPKVLADYHAMAGGLDLVTPRIALDPGRCLDAQNYEPVTIGGYRRINGFERYDGRPSPTGGKYWVLSATITGAVTLGATLTGLSSAATGKVLGTFGTTIVLGRVTGTFQIGDQLQISGVTVATATTPSDQRGAGAPSDDADYRLLAANDLRADILAVPGAGPIRGVFVLNDVRYAFRDNIGATHSLLYKATNAGWVNVALGREMLFQQRAGTVTISIATPGVVTWNNHGFANGQAIVLATTGALPTGLTAGTTYYVVSVAANTFQLAATAGGAAIATSGSQSGTHTATLTNATGIAVGNTVTGATSGATAVVTAVLLRAGSWGAAPVGSLVFAAVTGAFVNGEGLEVGGAAQAQANGVDAAISRLAGGYVETIHENFFGSANTTRAYGCDGVNLGFEFDGTVYAPIRTGMTTDTPTHVWSFRNMLFFAFGASVQFSGIATPYVWSVILGAGEFSTGAAVTGFVTQAGTAVSASLAIFTANRTFVLYGTGSNNFVLIPSIYELGYTAGTIQAVSNNTYGLTARGLQSLVTTLNYGDFQFAALSFFVQPLLGAKQGLATASVTLKSKNQYRLFFSDNTALVVGLTGEKVAGIMPLNYGKVVRCITNATLSDGTEVTYFGSDDGYVYQDNVGTSFDGAVIQAWVRPAFNNLKSPLVRKQYRRAKFEVDCEGFSQVNIGYDIGYANPDAQAPALQADQQLVGAGNDWDQFSWDSFTWDAALVTMADVSLDGAENNIGFLFYSKRAQDDPHTVQAVNLLFTPRRLVHSGT